MALPPVTLVRQFDTHRLVLSQRLEGGDSVLVAIADDDDHLRAIFDLDAATNDRLLAEHGRLPGIGVDELVFAVPHAAVINAAFCHPHPLGSRFSGPDRGAWYAGFELATTQAEVAFHKSVELAEIGRFTDSVTYDDYLADFSASFHDLRDPLPKTRGSHGREGGRRRFHTALDPDSYVASQALAERMLEVGSLGVVYPSTRRAGGTCLACFRPALVANVRRAKTYRFTWDGEPQPVIALERRG
ncbi:MAG TPA: RES family NAD+ phosphorylase [Vicinamibacterales bacterium]|nr:RES family NAD+ phosphorylase [Vicinamibacterales bacterium]